MSAPKPSILKPKMLDTLHQRITTLLPDLYQSPETPIRPTPMGSAALKFSPDGRVAWNEIWQSFCDLAMAGGPPHKGTLLAPATPEEIAANPGRTQQVAAEIARGITLTSGLEASPSRTPGWVRVECPNSTAAAWLLRAITMENVAVRAHGSVLELPASPAFRLEREIKSVIVVLAKTHHYWRDHIPATRQQAIATLFAELSLNEPLAQPTAGWRPIDFPTPAAAIKAMRLLIAANILARREATTLFIAQDPANDPEHCRANHVLSLLPEGIR